MPRLLVPPAVLVALTACSAGLSAWAPQDDASTPDDTAGEDTAGEDTAPGDTGEPDSGAGGGVAPTLGTFSVSEVAGDLVIVFAASDPDDDLDGGTLDLDVDGRPSTYGIPDALDSWTGTSGTVRIPTTSGGCGGQTYDVSGSVWDAAGHRSATLSDSVTVGQGAPGTLAPEVGDTIDDVVQIGTVTAPFTICGEAWGAANDGTYFTGDLDSLYLTVGETGVWTFELTWEASGSDYDFVLSDEFGVIVDYAATAGPAQPEEIVWLVFQGEGYYLDIGAWSGSGGPWTVAIYE